MSERTFDFIAWVVTFLIIYIGARVFCDVSQWQAGGIAYLGATLIEIQDKLGTIFNRLED